MKMSKLEILVDRFLESDLAAYIAGAVVGVGIALILFLSWTVGF